ncbi:MAG: hypothetical protein A2W19_03555 [Spirochaetes bacterium RBG_16_49_21]|nr:MAG: hypothetical protein A2W19_03555 [Spirochaetes bacterium RBG_16_49_21]
MNVKRFIIASIVVYIVVQVLDFIIHGLILADTYKTLANVWRPDMMSLVWIFYAAGLVFAVLFVYIFIKGYEGKGILEGVRYGAIMGLFMNVIGMFGQYVMYPIPFLLSLQWFIYGMIEFIIAGMVVAAIYRPE